MRLVLLLLPLWWACCATAVAADPDPDKVLSEAKTLARQGKYEEALQKHLWYHDNALKLMPSHAGVRLSFALSDWVELGRKYPKAKEALVATRDRNATALANGKGWFDLFHDVTAINRELDENAKTVQLFKAVRAKDPRLAAQCYHAAKDDLVAGREYELCSGYTPDALKAFDRIQEMRELNLKLAKDGVASLKEFADKSFTEETCRLIEILSGANRKPDAEKVRERALAVRNDAGLREAIEQAEKRARHKD